MEDDSVVKVEEESEMCVFFDVEIKVLVVLRLYCFLRVKNV